MVPALYCGWYHFLPDEREEMGVLSVAQDSIMTVNEQCPAKALFVAVERHILLHVVGYPSP